MGKILIPILVQAFTPIITEYIKALADYLHGKLPGSVNAALAGAVAEGVNQATIHLSGCGLPPGAGAIIAVILNEAGKDFGKQPPTPGVNV